MSCRFLFYKLAYLLQFLLETAHCALVANALHCEIAANRTSILFAKFPFRSYIYKMNMITEDSRIYAKDENGRIVAEITFPAKDGVATIDHTFVDESLRGKGIASKLVKAAVEKILADGNKIAATCSYAVKWLENHSEFSSLDEHTQRLTDEKKQ